MSWDSGYHVPWRSLRQQRVAGVKAATRAVAAGRTDRVYVARDANLRLIRGLLDLCESLGVEVVQVDTMQELGEYCGLRVGAAACAEIKKIEHES